MSVRKGERFRLRGSYDLVETIAPAFIDAYDTPTAMYLISKFDISNKFQGD